jgi:hydroxyacylglutathione hydrolase
MGCGRLFEGDAATMWRSIQKIINLPRDTAVYCAHEYTLANARFAVTVDPENEALRKRLLETKRARDAGMPTVPTTVGLELETNPFCRPASLGIRALLGMAGATDAEVFAETRRRKDAF